MGRRWAGGREETKTAPMRSQRTVLGGSVVAFEQIPFSWAEQAWSLRRKDICRVSHDWARESLMQQDLVVGVVQ